jgi:hypothetical protein
MKGLHIHTKVGFNYFARKNNQQHAYASIAQQKVQHVIVQRELPRQLTMATGLR